MGITTLTTGIRLPSLIRALFTFSIADWLTTNETVVLLGSFRLGYASLSNGRYGLARRLLTNSLLYDPTNRTGYVYWLSALGGRYTYRPARTLKRWAVQRVG